VARGWFEKRTFEVECGGETHTLTLLPSGHLRVNDHDLDMVAAFTAFGATKPRCVEVLDAYHGSMPARLPPELAFAIMAAESRLGRTAEAALEKADYRAPSQRWVDRAGLEFNVKKTPPGDERLETEVTTIWHSKFGKRKYPGKLVEVRVYLSFPGYIEVLRYIPDGLAYTKRGNAVFVVAIRKVHRVKRRVDSLEAIVGKQGRGLSVVEARALLKKDEHGRWVVKRWL
jgi:hypothetical protein